MRLRVAAFTVLVAHATASAEPSAEQLFDEGEQAFHHGDYALAIARYQSAYDLSKQSLLVLDIAQAYRLAGDCAQALSAYQRYLALDKQSEQRGLAEGFIAELSPQCGPRPQTIERVEQPVEESSRAGHDLKIAGLATTGAGVVVIATGLVFGQRAVSLGNEVTRDCTVPCDWSIEKPRQSNGQRDATIGKVLDGIGVAAIAAGVITYYLGDREGRIVVVPRPTGGGAITWTISW